MAIVEFFNTTETGEKFRCTCYIFIVRDWQGEPQETEEMTTPTWFPIDNLPVAEMMPADPDWVPLALDDEVGPFRARAYYGPRQSALLQETEIEFVDEL